MLLKNKNMYILKNMLEMCKILIMKRLLIIENF